MDLSSLRQQILSSNKTASEKAEDFLTGKQGSAAMQGDTSVYTADPGIVMVDAVTDRVPVRSFKVPKNQHSKLDVAIIENLWSTEGLCS
ncbi:MAG: hypothetical protein FRX49_05813 [Trebouxia sp. A1-2]|nr:MAG: hypothetical protein FRX49_05813 [Trebouxia sp. A1-2]